MPAAHQTNKVIRRKKFYFLLDLDWSKKIWYTWKPTGEPEISQHLLLEKNPALNKKNVIWCPVPNFRLAPSAKQGIPNFFAEVKVCEATENKNFFAVPPSRSSTPNTCPWGRPPRRRKIHQLIGEHPPARFLAICRGVLLSLGRIKSGLLAFKTCRLIPESALGAIAFQLRPVIQDYKLKRTVIPATKRVVPLFFYALRFAQVRGLSQAKKGRLVIRPL